VWDRKIDGVLTHDKKLATGHLFSFFFWTSNEEQRKTEHEL
jgi:hypothetical protein